MKQFRFMKFESESFFFPKLLIIMRLLFFFGLYKIKYFMFYVLSES